MTRVDEIICECLLRYYVNSTARSISEEVWKEAQNDLFNAGIMNYRHYKEIRDHFWNNIYPRLREVMPGYDEKNYYRIMYAKFFKLNGIRLVMTREGAENLMADDVLQEAEAIVKYFRYDEFDPGCLEQLKKLERKEYRINLDDPRLKLPLRIKLKLVRDDFKESLETINMPVAEDAASELEPSTIHTESEPSSSKEKCLNIEKKGRTTVVSSKGFTVVTKVIDNDQKFIFIPESQDVNLSIEQALNSDTSNNSLPDSYKAPENPKEPPAAIFKKVFQPLASSTQDYLISPIKSTEASQEITEKPKNVAVPIPQFNLPSDTEPIDMKTSLSHPKVAPEPAETSQNGDIEKGNLSNMNLAPVAQHPSSHATSSQNDDSKLNSLDESFRPSQPTLFSTSNMSIAPESQPADASFSRPLCGESSQNVDYFAPGKEPQIQEITPLIDQYSDTARLIYAIMERCHNNYGIYQNLQRAPQGPQNQPRAPGPSQNQPRAPEPSQNQPRAPEPPQNDQRAPEDDYMFTDSDSDDVHL